MRHWLILIACAWLAQAATADDGRGQYLFNAWGGPPLRVYYTQPPGLAHDRPVVMVMHGMSRNPDVYRDQWHELAIEYDFLLLVPEFSRADFPGSRAYNLGNLRDEDGTPVPAAQWSFAAPVPLFEEARKRFAVQAERFALYGHSAGSQFVHRFLMFVPQAPVSRVVAANAGWYTLPDFTVGFPYGLKGAQVNEAALNHLLQLPLTILLGDADTLTDQSNLNQSEGALAQGPHRYARGHTFFVAGQSAARQAGLPFAWQVVTVNGADHDNAKMAPIAVRYLLPEEPGRPSHDPKTDGVVTD